MRTQPVVQILMVLAIPVLVLLIIFTPRLTGEPSGLASIPVVIIDAQTDSLILDVTGAFDHYRYRNITLRVRSLDNASLNFTVSEEETYDVHVAFPRISTNVFDLNVTLFDQEDRGFDYNATVRFTGGPEDAVMIVTERPSDRTVRTDLPGEFRALVSQRSMT